MTALPYFFARVPEIDILAGVFGFLDGALPANLRAAAEEKDFGVGHAEPCEESYLIAKILNTAFRLQWRECPIRHHLVSKYQLYHRDDMADALMKAYGLHKRGLDPEAALVADYALPLRGLLFHEDIEEFKSTQTFFWDQLRAFHQSGDRIILCRSRAYHYYMLVRGDRLVWEVECLHLCVVGPSPRWNAQVDHFQALGGSKAFLNGEFIWPPHGWVNPVSDEEEAASLGKWRMMDFKKESGG